MRFIHNHTGTQSGLGLGPNSTFLDAAVRGGFAPSRAFGLWMGSRSINNPAAGSLWVGGYDTARVADDFTVFPNLFNDLCVGCVNVTNITYVNSKTSVSLISNSSDTFFAVVDPFERVLQVPSKIFANYLRATGGKIGTDHETQPYVTLPTDADLGNLSVTFSNGYRSTIPASELWLPPRSYRPDGTYEITNNTYLVGLVENTTLPTNYSFSWGTPLLTMNYMIMDYDNDTFSLAPARQGPYNPAEGPVIKPLCKGIMTVSTTASTPSSTSAGNSSTSNSPSSASHKNAGAIAGGVVGGAVGILVVGFLAFFLLRSQRRERKLRRERKSADGSTAVDANLGSANTSPVSQPFNISFLHVRIIY